MKFLQIGVHIGNDEAFDIIKHHDIELGILVEPLPHLIPHIKENYVHKRMGAEFWIGSNPSSKMKCIYNYDFHQEPFSKEFTIKDYING